jgi:hypothetical protein
LSDSKNPIEELVRKLGFKGKNAGYITIAIFAVCAYIAIGIFLEGVYA